MKVKDIVKSFKYINPFYWINRRKNKEIYLFILATKYYYISEYNNGRKFGLCLSFEHMYQKYHIALNLKRVAKINQIIPEFNKEFFNITHTLPFWWDLNDCNSRILAFNKLLQCYKDKIK